jgi:hypothetical protein
MISGKAQRLKRLLSNISESAAYIARDQTTQLANLSKQVWTNKESTTCDFTFLINLLMSIQKKGQIPRLSYIEDVLPIRVYINKASKISSFEGKPKLMRIH